MNINTLIFRVALLFFASLFLLNSCKEDSDIGKGMLPEGDIVSVVNTDTSTVLAYTLLEDTVSTVGTSVVLAGQLNDPQFGYLKAGFLTEVTLPYVPLRPELMGDIVSVNLNLTLKYIPNGTDTIRDFYGNRNVNQTFNVYALTDTLRIDSSYNANTDATNFYDQNAQPIATFDYNINHNDTVLSITLPYSYNALFANADSMQMYNYSAFRNMIKGFYITPTENADAGSIMYVDLLDERSNLSLHYEGTLNDTVTKEFLINSGCVKFSVYEKEHSQNLTQILNNSQAEISDSVLYIEGCGSTRGLIKFPFIEDYSGFAIVNATLEFRADTSNLESIADYPMIEELLMLKATEDGEVTLLGEYGSYIGVILDTETNTYTFDITAYVQSVINGEERFGLYIAPAKTKIDPSRSIIKNNYDDITDNIILRISYVNPN